MKANAMKHQGREEFRRIIKESPVINPRTDQNDLLEPLDDLVAAMNEEGVAAELVSSSDGRLSLVLWPVYRPSYRSLFLPLMWQGSELIALMNTGSVSFRSADELRTFLRMFASRPEFKAGLAHLREQAQQPVEAVLRSENKSLLVEIPACDQQRLGEASPDDDIPLTITIREGQALPSAPLSLVSAGLHFRVLSSSTQHRTLSLYLRKITKTP